MSGRNMSEIYRYKTLEALQSLRLEKVYQLGELEREAPTYYNLQEARRLNHLLKQITVEILSRLDQMDLL